MKPQIQPPKRRQIKDSHKYIESYKLHPESCKHPNHVNVTEKGTGAKNQSHRQQTQRPPDVLLFLVNFEVPGASPRQMHFLSIRVNC